MITPVCPIIKVIVVAMSMGKEINSISFMGIGCRESDGAVFAMNTRFMIQAPTRAVMAIEANIAYMGLL